MVKYVKNDLEFILDQIKIAEQHAALSQGATLGESRQILLGLLPSAESIFGLRTVDGSLNNLIPGQENFGAADGAGSTVEFPRSLEASYSNEMDELGFPLGPPPAPVVTNTDYSVSGNVVDSDPRTISNLIVDQTANNFSAVAAMADNAGSSIVVSPGLDGEFGTADDVEVFKIPNVAPDFGLTAPFNGWMTFFGQFFDHGLSLVNKGGSGAVFMPLQPDDPLFDAGPDGIPGTLDDGPTNFMVLTRASVDAGPDGILGTADDVEGPVNAITPHVDQNQTYSSHSSVQVFLRAYTLNGAGEPVSTGRLLENRDLVDGVFGNGDDITSAGADGILGTADDVTAPGIGGMATWGIAKAQARALLGIELDDLDALNMPLLLADQYGNFIPGPLRGMPQLVTAAGLVEGDPAAPVDATDAFRTDSTLLLDIAHNAVPVTDAITGLLVPDGDSVAGNPIAVDPMTGQNLAYDDELFDQHFVAGDGRVNENIALTSIHHVFHSEHNRLVEHTKSVLLGIDAAQDGNIVLSPLALLNEYLLVPVAAIPTLQADIDALVWNGERLFQAAKFGTEMQYQHLVFEEFARKIQPLINVFANYDTAIDPSIVMEFAQAVYRFGHSMLTETVDRFTPNFTVVDDGILNDGEQLGLIRAFLNPLEFDNQDTQTPVEAAGSIVRGMTRVVGNEIDEFVTEALRNNLVGLPLDLAAINIARGRDVGVPTLNAARAEFFRGTADPKLAPYESWVDFAQNVKHELSVVNFIAAYGTHDLITGQDTLAGKRAAAWSIVTGQTVGVDGLDGIAGTADDLLAAIVAPADRIDFLNSTGDWAPANPMAKPIDRDAVSTTGLGNVDLWIGGLAEQIEFFGGMLGSTFAFVFENQLENLQDGDRFYYLARTAGLNLLTQLEQNSFAEMVIRNTDATHLPGDIFSTPDFILEVDQTKQFNNGTGVFLPGPDGILGDDPSTLVDESLDDVEDTNADPLGSSIFFPLVNRVDPNDPLNLNFLQYQRTGGANGIAHHIVVGGTELADTIITSTEDDTLWGDGGDDYLNSGTGADVVFGGTGDDIIITEGGPGPSNLQGQEGNDVISAGPGLALILAGAGKDYVLAGADLKETFGGSGDDIIDAGTDANGVIGGEGDDWLEGNDGNDVLNGDNADAFQTGRVIGHDVLLGGVGVDDLHGESGDDIIVGSSGVDFNEGALGFDWTTHKDSMAGVESDMLLGVGFEVPVAFSPLADFDRFLGVEGLSGSRFADSLRGDHATALELGLLFNGLDNVLRNFDLIDGLRGTDNTFNLFDLNVLEWGEGNILLGGDGSDLLEGRSGNDIIDGDLWLNVRLSIRASEDPASMELATVDDMKGVIQAGAGVPAAWVGRALNDLILDRSINPGQLHIVREILTDTTNNDPTSPGFDGDFDTALFTDIRANYTIETIGGGVIGDGDGDGFIQVTHNVAPGVGGGVLDDGTDLLRNVERLQFSDQSINLAPGLNAGPVGLLTISGIQEIGQTLTVTSENITDPDNTLSIPAGSIPGTFQYTWQAEQTDGLGDFADLFVAQGILGEVLPVTGPTFTLTNEVAGTALRVRGTYEDQNGVLETVLSASTGPIPPSLSISDATVNENAGTMTFTVTLGVAADLPISVDFATADGTAVAGAPGLGDYDAINGTLNFAAGVINQQIVVTINNDAVFEGDENFVVNLTNPLGATILDGQGLGTIVDDDVTPALSIDDVIVNENAGTMTFTVSLSGPSTTPVTVDFATADGTAVAGAAGSGDYDAINGTLNFAAGVTSQQIVVTINDDAVLEGNENFVVDLTNAIGATILDGQGLGTIADDEGVPTMSIDDVIVNETPGGSLATFTVSLSAPSAVPVTVDVATADGTAIAGAPGLGDYDATNGTLTFAAGVTSQQVVVQINDDAVFEGNENFVVDLTNAIGATILDGQGLGTIVDDEVAPTLSIDDVVVNEAMPAPVPVTLIDAGFIGGVGDLGGFTYSDGVFGGLAPTIYADGNRVVAGNGDAGALHVTLGDVDNADIVSMSGGWEQNFNLADTSAVTIAFDYMLDHAANFEAIETADALMSLDGAAPTVLASLTGDGNGGPIMTTGWQSFEVTLDLAAGAHTLALGGFLNQKSFGDEESNVFFDNVAVTALSLAPAPGASQATFTVSLSAPSATPVTVDFASADGTAIAGAPGLGDYDAINGTLNFAAGVTSQQVVVQINDDALFEGNEGFAVDLTNAVGATILDGQGLGTIVDDEGAPTLSIDDVIVSEAAGTMIFTVSLSGPSTTPVTVDFATADGTAIAGAAGSGDYDATNGTLTFAAGVTSQQIVVTINDDAVFEGNENFVVDLTNAVGATILDGQGVGTIADDEVVTLIDADFIGGVGDLGGFTYSDGVFGGLAPTIYADGGRVIAGNGNAGSLHVMLGDVDNADIVSMSGAWERNFNLAAMATVSIAFDYMLDHAANFEAIETADALMSVDGGVPTVLASLTGDGNGGADMTTGWQNFAVTIDLAAGAHTLALGGFLNQKSFGDEESNVFFDNVVVTAQAPCSAALPTPLLASAPAPLPAAVPAPAPAAVLAPVSAPAPAPVTLVDADFIGGIGDLGGFTYSDGLFGGLASTIYADGNRAVAGNGDAGSLHVTLGDVDNADIGPMSGGWEQNFNLADTSTVTIAFDYMLDHAANFEAIETVDALMSLDGGAPTVLASLTGDGNGGPIMTTGWQSFAVTLDLAAGAHTLALGGFLNQKSFADEVSNVFFDNIVVAAQSGLVGGGVGGVATAGADLLFGTASDDTIDGLAGNDTIFGIGGNDTLNGGPGDDMVDGGTGNDTIVAGLSDGDDDYDGGAGIDTYDLSGTSTGATVDLAAATASSAETGNDQLVGIENVIGGFGDDTILASNAVNVLTGGAGGDIFVFQSLEQAGTSEAMRDQITDFQPGDVIDLSAIDANSLIADNQSFDLVFDTPTFTAAGEIKFRNELQADGDHTILEGNVDGDLQADFQIDIAGRHDLTASDFAGVA